MTEIFSFFNQGWVGSVIGLAGLLSAFWLYWQSRIGPVLSFQHNGATLIGGTDAAFPDEVQVTWRGVEVERITVTWLWFWNSGKKSVQGSDIVVSDPLTIKPGGRILKARVVRQSRPVIGTVLGIASENRRSASLKFDFLDPGDGVLLEVLHTGDRLKPRIDGTVRGLPGVNDWGKCRFDLDGNQAYPGAFGRINRIAMPVALVFGLSFVLLGLFYSEIQRFFPGVDALLSTDPSPPKPAFFLLMGFLYMLLPAQILWSRRRRFPKALLPSADEQEAAEKAEISVELEQQKAEEVKSHALKLASKADQELSEALLNVATHDYYVKLLQSLPMEAGALSVLRSRLTELQPLLDGTAKEERPHRDCEDSAHQRREPVAREDG